MGILDQRAIDRISGPSWQKLRNTFLAASDTLLRLSDDACGVLTTIYVKYSVSDHFDARVFAVIWLKSSQRLVIGLALPNDYDAPVLENAPAGMSYKGLNKYLVIHQGDELPSEFGEWAHAAYLEARDQ